MKPPLPALVMGMRASNHMLKIPVTAIPKDPQQSRATLKVFHHRKKKEQSRGNKTVCRRQSDA